MLARNQRARIRDIKPPHVITTRTITPDEAAGLAEMPTQEEREALASGEVCPPDGHDLQGAGGRAPGGKLR